MKVAFLVPRTPLALLLAAIVVAIWAGAAICQPGTLYYHSAIYDPVRQRMVVFGGFDNDLAIITNDVWEFTLDDHPRWNRLAPEGVLPPKRYGHSAVYDPVGDRMLIFGGDSSGTAVLNDVWALSLSDPPRWSNVLPLGVVPCPGTSPCARRYHTAIYDAPRERMIVFGGDRESGSVYLNDAWSLQLTPTPQWDSLEVNGARPSARRSHSAICDSPRDRMVVFGGDFFGPSDDVWALSLVEPMGWQQLQPSGNPLPSERIGHSAIYDPHQDRMLVFGGRSGTYFNDAWQLSLGTQIPVWSPLPSATVSPSPRGDHSVVYDSLYRRMVIFGGQAGGPRLSEPTWALSLDQAMRWSPDRPVIEVSPALLEPQTVTIGDTVSVPFVVSNFGLQPLQVTDFRLPAQAIGVTAPGPFQLTWNQAVAETLRLAATSPGIAQDSVVAVSNDPLTPRSRANLGIDVRGLDFGARVLDEPAEAPLGVALIVVVTPEPQVRVERGTLYYRIVGASAFDSLALTPLATDFIAAIPAAAVTERGVEYYVKVENSGFWATQPAGAPAAFFTQAVAAPSSVTAVPRPSSGPDFLVGRDIEVEILLPDGTSFVSGDIHYRQGGQQVYATGTFAPDLLGRPVATIPESFVGPSGVEYWAEVRTLKTLETPLRYPAFGAAFDVIRTTVQNLVEPSEHPGSRYRLLTVPLDLGDDFSGSLDAVLSDQFGPYDPVRWRAYSYDPSAGNVEFSAAEALRFKPVPSRAFWLISRQDHRVDTAPVEGLSTSTGGNIEIPLAQGWNQFGNPFAFPVAWSDVIRDPAAVDTDPVAFDPSLGRIGDYAEQPPTVLAPFEGYFVHATQATTLRVPPRAAPSTPAREHPARPRERAAADGSAPGSAPEDLWRLRLAARSDQAMDASNTFGLRTGAAAGFDPLDSPKPPPAPGPWVRAAFTHSDWRERSGEYRRDLRAPGVEGETWEVEVRSSTPGEPVTIELSQLVPAASGLAVRLIDREQGSTAEWLRAARASAGFAAVGLDSEEIALRYRIVSLGSRPYRLAVVAGSEAYVAQATERALAVPPRMTLDQNAPNPFALATRVRFGLSHATEVSLEIYSVLGQRVATLLDRAPLGPGYHTAVWDGGRRDAGRAPNGVYLLRLVVGGETLTRRMVLVR
jgi:hypothetical protein